MSKKIFIFALAMMVTCAFASFAMADQTVTHTIEYEGKATALGVKVTLPEGCSFVGVQGENAPAVAPKAGTTGTLEFAWIDIPASGFTFAYAVSGDCADEIEVAEIVTRN